MRRLYCRIRFTGDNVADFSVPHTVTPQEIAKHLVTHLDSPHLDRLLQELKPQLDLEVIRALAHLAVNVARRKPYEGLKVANLSAAVAEVIGTEEARAMGVWNQGNAYIPLNRYQEALACFQKAEPYYWAAGKDLSVAGLQINQVIVLRELGEYERALSLAKTARETCEIAGGAKAEIYLANLYTSIGWVYEEIGDFETALTTYKNGHDLYIKHDKQSSAASVDMNRAHLLETMDRFEEAEGLLHEARTVFVTADEHPRIARTDLNLGRVVHRRGDYQLALQHLERALDGFVTAALPVEVAVVNQSRMMVYHKLNLLQEMVNLAAETEAIFRQNKMQREWVLALYYQGIGYARLGDHDLAERLLAQARRLLYRQKTWRKLWLVDTERAELALRQGRPETARRIARRVQKQIVSAQQPALAARLNLLLARCFLAATPAQLAAAQGQVGQALIIADEFHLLEEQIAGRQLLAHILTLSGEPEAGWQTLQQAVQHCEDVRHNLLLDELQLGFMEDKLPLYSDAVQGAYQRWQQHHLSLAHLFAYLTLAQKAPWPYALTHAPDENERLTPELRARLADLRRTWHWHHEKLADGGDRAKDIDAAAVRDTLVQIEAQIGELRRREQVRYTVAKPAGARGWLPTGMMAAVQARLGAGEALLQLFEAAGQVQAFLLTAAGGHMVSDLVVVSRLEQQLGAWRFFIQQTHPHSAQAANEQVRAQAHLHRLYQALWPPLQPHLAAVDHLYLVLPPAWQELPIAALYDGRHYVVEQLALSHLTSAEALLTQATPSWLEDKDRPEAWLFAYSENGRLPATVAEAQAVAGVLAPQWQPHLAIEAAATRQAVMAAAASARLLHLATHAVYRPDNPLFSWLALADARLTVAEWYELPMRQRPLVVLSGCETGRGTPRGGGLLGMGRGLLAAGASALLLTLWPLEDENATGLIKDFYVSLQAGKRQLPNERAASALHEAQVTCVNTGLSPFYWAGYIFIAG